MGPELSDPEGVISSLTDIIQGTKQLTKRTRYIVPLDSSDGRFDKEAAHEVIFRTISHRIALIIGLTAFGSAVTDYLYGFVQNG